MHVCALAWVGLGNVGVVCVCEREIVGVVLIVAVAA